ncbi:MAG TPA: hypothetical protein VHC22_10080 [Pirellulales bacterium]|nr:hypothetical protein [Pirellulales bacterium]
MRNRLAIQFSLRALLVFTACFCVWLAIVVQHARHQAAAVAEIEALGGIVYFKHQDVTRLARKVPKQPIPRPCYDRFRQPPGSRWLRKLLGDDFFREAAVVDLTKTNASDAELARVIASLPRAAIRCPPSWAARHGQHNIGPTPGYDYDPVSLAVAIASLAFTAWIVCLSYARFRRNRTPGTEALLRSTGADG